MKLTAQRLALTISLAAEEHAIRIANGTDAWCLFVTPLF
jgi:hypothetical protein